MARIIDARTGRDAIIGGVYDGWRLTGVDDRFFSAVAHLERANNPLQKTTAPLVVRFLHPSYPFRRVIFLPT